MSARNRLVLPVLLSTLAILVACGGVSMNQSTPPPTGSFSRSNFNGSYTFSTAGTDSTGFFFSLAGTLQANGNGGITGGTLDLNDAGLTSPISNLAITSGTYIVTSDGRGQATLRTSAGTLALDFVLLNNSHAMVTRYDSNGTGGGSMDLQSSVTQAQLAGSYGFTLGGIDANNNSLATVGSFTLDASGNITAGVEDFNDGGIAYPALSLTGSVMLGSGAAPGTATLTATDSSSRVPFGTLTFDVYTVNGTDLKFVEADTTSILGGDAFSQQGAALPSQPTVLAFSMVGGVTAPLATAGLLTVDGVSAISNGLEDINNNGVSPAASLSFTGSYSAPGPGGRTVISLTGFSGASQFVAYPTAGGVQLLEMDNGGLLSGVALAQAPGTALAASQGYGMGVTAVNIGGFTGAFEEDDVAEFSTTSTALNGLVDINDEGTLAPAQRFNGNYAADSSANGRGVISTNFVNGIYYAIDANSALFLETDSNQVGSGSIQLQTPGASPALSTRQMIATHLAPIGHKAAARR